MINRISESLIGYGISDYFSSILSYAILSIFIILICLLVNILINNILLKIIGRIIRNNKYRWDNIMYENRVFSKIAGLFPGIIIYLFAPAFDKITEALIRRGCAIYICVISLFIISSLLNSIDQIYRNYPISKIRPIKGFLQVVKIIFFIIVSIIIVGI